MISKLSFYLLIMLVLSLIGPEYSQPHDILKEASNLAYLHHPNVVAF
jgi:hypothetical protein